MNSLTHYYYSKGLYFKDEFNGNDVSNNLEIVSELPNAPITQSGGTFKISPDGTTNDNPAYSYVQTQPYNLNNDFCMVTRFKALQSSIGGWYICLIPYLGFFDDRFLLYNAGTSSEFTSLLIADGVTKSAIANYNSFDVDTFTWIRLSNISGQFIFEYHDGADWQTVYSATAVTFGNDLRIMLVASNSTSDSAYDFEFDYLHTAPRMILDAEIPTP